LEGLEPAAFVDAGGVVRNKAVYERIGLPCFCFSGGVCHATNVLDKIDIAFVIGVHPLVSAKSQKGLKSGDLGRPIGCYLDDPAGTGPIGTASLFRKQQCVRERVEGRSVNLVKSREASRGINGCQKQGEASAHRAGRKRGEPSRHLPPIAFIAFLQNHDQIGNRAFGERLSQLADLNRISLARAILLLSPQIPMLFMGEEWQASSPFLYFVDFPDDRALLNAVREGRCREFGRFNAFATDEASARIPDPTIEDTFRRSKLDWNEHRLATHAQAYCECKELLSLRAKEIVPLLRKRFDGASEDQQNGIIDLAIRWRTAAVGPQSVRANSSCLCRQRCKNNLAERRCRDESRDDRFAATDRPITPELQNVTKDDGTIDLIARLAGILSGYRDTKGAYIETSDHAKCAVLEGLGLDISSGTAALSTLEELQSRAAQPLDPVVTACELEPRLIPLRAGSDLAALEIWATSESDPSRSTRCEVSRKQGELVLILPALESGYYRLSLRMKAAEVVATLIVAPPRCWLPRALQKGIRGWGATANAYGLRSDDDLGIGDFTLIGKAAEACGKLGASFLGLNPLHALFSADRTRISPYSPSSRLFLEPLYIDPCSASDRLGVGGAKLLRAPQLAALSDIRSSNLVDYKAAWRLKREILDRLWIRPKESPEQATFAQFRANHDETLARHATFGRFPSISPPGELIGSIGGPSPIAM
jgi:hypothetical protein